MATGIDAYPASSHRSPDATHPPIGRVVGRFAPSPTGPLHAGSLAAAMASWLDVRARRGRWIVRIEDLDGPRGVDGAAADILATLTSHGFRWDGPVVFQSERNQLYQRAFDSLHAANLVYPCGCTRREIDTVATAPDRAPARIYPGTCRDGLPPGRVPRAWRVRVADRAVTVHDRGAGSFVQDLGRDVGDFIVRRADGLWAYQLAVVVDDADQGVTDVVRGADLLDSTPRQRWLQELLGLPMPRTLHIPLVLDRAGYKLAKSQGAMPLNQADPLSGLGAAARHLGLAVRADTTVQRFWEAATSAWSVRWPP